MIRSLRWRLQVWHAAVLAAVLAIFGGFVYALQWQTRLQQIDSELDRTASVLTSRLRRLLPIPMFRWPPRGGNPGGRMPFVLIPRRDGEGREPRLAPFDLPEGEFPPADLPHSGPPPAPPPAPAVAEIPQDATAVESPAVAELPEGPPAPRGNRREWPSRGAPGAFPPMGLELPEEFAQVFEGPEGTHLYYIIWDREGEVLARSASAPEVPYPALKVKEDGLPVRVLRGRDGHREVVHASRFEMNVLVGKPIAHEIAAHRASAARLGAIGLGVLGVGLIGGWWSTSRAMRPIATMAATAESISGRNLSQRIDVAGTDNELGQLAVVLNQAFDRLESAFQKQTQFTADASHELRTPVSVILANTEFSLSRARSEEEYRESLESCRRAAQRMKSLIESLLMLARFDAGKSGADRATVDLPQLAEETAALVSPLAKQREISVIVTTEPAFVSGNREQLGQVLINLLTNAIRYNRDEGTVRLAVSVHGGQALMTISDDGIGIPPEHLPHVFDRFYRVDAARSRSDGGSGLGLSICRTIVEAHGGAISVRSVLGAGTTIEVRFPRLPGVAAPKLIAESVS